MRRLAPAIAIATLALAACSGDDTGSRSKATTTDGEPAVEIPVGNTTITIAADYADGAPECASYDGEPTEDVQAALNAGPCTIDDAGVIPIIAQVECEGAQPVIYTSFGIGRLGSTWTHQDEAERTDWTNAEYCAVE